MRFYWNDQYVVYDWNPSWNDESYMAAKWLSENIPEDAIVGSWNAGVLGYYAKQRVVNLDGLINNYDFLPYIEQNRVSDYIRREGISYLSDMDDMFQGPEERKGAGRWAISANVREELKLTEVYTHYSPLMRQHYRIYKVDDREEISSASPHQK